MPRKKTGAKIFTILTTVTKFGKAHLDMLSYGLWDINITVTPKYFLRIFNNIGKCSQL